MPPANNQLATWDDIIVEVAALRMAWIGAAHGASLQCPNWGEFSTDVSVVNVAAYANNTVLDIVNFRYRTNNTLPRVGFIAEDSDSIFTGDGKQFDIANAIGILLKAVQELSGERELARC